MSVLSLCIHLPNSIFSFHHWRHSECKHSSSPPHCLSLCVCATLLWNIVDIPAAACISATSTAAYDRPNVTDVTWFMNGSLTECQNKDRATRSRQGCPARSRGKLKSERERNLIIMHHWCESSTIKHSHDCSSRPDHKGELFLAFPTCYIWHLCFNN